MKVVIQRVSSASVEINNIIKSKIHNGYLIFLGIESNDNNEDILWLVNKISQLRIFDDTEGLMNLSINDIKGDILIISQFTLHAKTKKGNRPSFIKAAKPDISLPLYEEFIKELSNKITGKVKTGEFGAKMGVSLVNDGPITIIIDTKNKE